MEKVYSKVKPNILLGVVNRFSEISDGRVDIAPDKEFIQVLPAVVASA